MAGYKIYFNRDYVSLLSNFVNVGNKNNFNLNDNYILPNQQYYYAISCYNSNGLEGLIAEIGSLHTLGVTPVELSSFNLILNNAGVELLWETESETNNLGFDIERDSGEGWRKIGFIAGYGTTNQKKKYYFRDTDLRKIGNLIRYRLKQIDTNGTYAYSMEKSIIDKLPLKLQLYQNYPNPFNPATTIEFSLLKGETVSLKICLITGQTVQYLLNEPLLAGQHKVKWNAKGLASGVYFYILQAGDYQEVRKAILMK